MKSEFLKYMKRADQVGRKTMKELAEAEAAVTAAQEELRKFPQTIQRPGALMDGKTAQKIADRAKAQAKLYEAQDAQIKAKVRAGDYQNRLAAIREELEEAADLRYVMEPEKIDTAALQLFKDDILTEKEYRVFYDRYAGEDNYTMLRVIRPFLEKKMEELVARGESTEDFSVMLHGYNAFGSAEILNEYDILCDVIHRCVENPAMADRYDDLVGDLLTADEEDD